MNNKLFKLAPLSAAILLAGCSIAPQPLTTAEIDTIVDSDRQTMFADRPSQVADLTLEEAIDMAMSNNFELRQKMMEEAIASQQLELAHYDMLPELVAAAGYTSRNNQNASRSVTAQGAPSSQASTSQDKNITTANLATTWNALDFGVSYYQAKQAADQTLISEQRRRKIVHNLAQQVRALYWNAVGAQHLQQRITPLLKDAQDALAKAEKVGQEQLVNPLESLRYRKELLEIVRQLESLRDDLSQAKPELAALLGLPPGTSLTLAIPEQFELQPPTLNYDLEAMENLALANRPELLEANYQRRITALDTRKALARMLPGLEVSLGQYYDSNSFLVNDSWTQGGLRVSWNLFNLLSWTSSTELAEAQEELADAQRLALNMAVLSQVHVAWLDYQSLQREFQRASELAAIDREIYSRMQKRRSGAVQSRMEEIKSASSALTEELKMFRAYAGLQEAYGRIQATLGQEADNVETGGFVVTAPVPAAPIKPVTASHLPASATAPVSPTLTPPTSIRKHSPSTTQGEVFALISRWSNAWQSKDLQTYLAQYSRDFPGTSAQAHSRWAADRTRKFAAPGKITLSLDSLKFRQVGRDSATVTFNQTYRSAAYTDRVYKTLNVEQIGGEWKIVAEAARSTR